MKIMLWLCKSEKLNTWQIPFDNCFSFFIAVSAFGELQNFAPVGPVFGFRKYCLFWLIIFVCVCVTFYISFTLLWAASSYQTC